MKKLTLIFCLISFPCFGQTQANPTQQRIETIIGKLFVENASLATTIEDLNKQITDLKKQLEDKNKK